MPLLDGIAAALTFRNVLARQADNDAVHGSPAPMRHEVVKFAAHPRQSPTPTS
jgi:hypothetical protein